MIVSFPLTCLKDQSCLLPKSLPHIVRDVWKDEGFQFNVSSTEVVLLSGSAGTEEILQFAQESLLVLKISIDGRKADVGDFVELAEFIH